MTALLEISKEKGIHVVEDAAEALGSRKGSRALGVIGDLGCFSFSPNKTITTGQGGLVVTSDSRLYGRLRELKDQGRPVRGTGGADEHVSLGFNFKLTNLQAAVGLAQLESFGSRQQHLKNVYRTYRQELNDVPGIRFPGFNVEAGECPQWVDVQVDGRDGLHDFLLQHGVETRKFWRPIHTQTPYKSGDAGFEGAIAVSSGALWLPSALTLTAEDLSIACRRIREWAENTRAMTV
jgi:perosamine synthetase